MKNSYSIVIYTHASSDVGLGHLNRCIVLGQALRRLNHTVTLICDGDPNETLVAVENMDWVIYSDKNYLNFTQLADMCIVDLYCYDDEFYTYLRKFYELIIIFDDHKFIAPKNVSGVINTNLYAKKSDYSFGIRKFLGPKYALLREAFIEKNEVIKDPNRVFVCVGGSDPTNQMNRILSAVTTSSNHTVVAVYGPAFHDTSVIQTWQSHPKVETYIAPENIADLMASSDYAITAAGGMLFELAVLGVPVIAIGLADNQELSGRAFDDKGGCFFLGMYSDLSDCQLKKSIENLDLNYERKVRMSRAQRSICDGKGAMRLAEDIICWLELRKTPFLSPYIREEVEAEYNESSDCVSEHEQVRWGTAESMLNRHLHVLETLPFDAAKKWIDVGAGVGALQVHVVQKNPMIRGTALELSQDLFNIALKKNINQIIFKNEDFLEHTEAGYDLLTCLGVLAKTNMGIKDFITHAANILLVGGLMMIDFKCKDWIEFGKNDLYPDARHLWFTKDEILDYVHYGSYFKVEKIYGFDPSRSLELVTNESHTVFVIARKIF